MTKTIASVCMMLLLAGCQDDSPGGSGDTDPMVSTTDGSGTGDTDVPTGGGVDESGTGDPTDGPVDGIPPADGIRQLVEAQCGWVFACCSGGERLFELGPFTGNETECVERVIGVLESGSPGAPIKAGPSDLLLALSQAHALGRIDFDPQAVDACAQHLASQACNAFLEPGSRCDPADSMPLNDPCALDVLAIGKQDIGEACEPSVGAECMTGSRCVDYGTSGVCAALAMEGETCFADADCDAALVCDLADSGTCVTGAGQGEACSFSNPDNPVPGTEVDRCARGLTCDAAQSTCFGGTCGPGAPCDVDEECPEDYACIVGSCLAPQGGGGPCTAPEHCLSGFCDLGQQACSEPTGKPDGASCFSANECLSGWCDFMMQVCAPPRPPGDPCPSLNALECDEGYCDTSDIDNPVCTAFSGDGDPCQTVTQCDPDLQLQCVDMTCRKLEEGEPCGSSLFCETELCFGGVCDVPLGVGEACGQVAMNRPCIADAYCEIPLGQTDGSCVLRRSAGQPCSDDEQCLGACVEAWGERMCDGTPPAEGAWCDGG